MGEVVAEASSRTVTTDARSDRVTPLARARAWAEVRSAPVVATMAMVIAGMAFSLFWTSLIHGGPARLTSPGDLWSLASSSSAILHAHFSGIYYPNGALTSPPALEYLLAPVLALGRALGLTSLTHGTTGSMSLWLILGPAAALIGSTALFAIDAIARTWGMTERARLALALVGGLGVANVVFGWGHPEDCAAIALVLWAALVLDREGMTALPKAAWLLGFAIAFQPLALLGVVPILAGTPWRSVAKSSARLAVPSVVALMPPLLASSQRTFFVMVRQPFQPKFVSFTPLTHLAPSLSAGVLGGGPTRLFSTVVGAVLAFVVCRKRRQLDTVVLMIVAAVALRLLFETELNWYYFWPVGALCLLLALHQNWTRFGLCSAAFIASMVLGNHRVHSIGLWWPAIIAAMTVMLLSVAPRRTSQAINSSPQVFRGRNRPPAPLSAG